MKIAFKALEYTSRDRFIESEYNFSGDIKNGWQIKRNGKDYLRLGPGYRLLKSKLCGICSTDLSRRFSPYPLPQVIGHEVVAVDPDTGKEFVVEINDTCSARGDEYRDIFCQSNLSTHSPDRMVLGIDRLPGGFGQYILAPVNAAIPIGEIPPRTAVLIEPFAAALQALRTSPPQNGDNVAVLGPGRLGLLMIAALNIYRKSSKKDFTITSLAILDLHIKLSIKMGTDNAVDLKINPPESLKEKFDIVYDTTGSPSGFESALIIAKRELHLKSTHGQDFFSMKHLTELVVDEISILPFCEKNLAFHWADENRINEWLFISPEVEILDIPSVYAAFKGDYQSAKKFLESEKFKERIPRFDIGIASNIDEIDRNIRPNPTQENSIIRPRGAILFRGDDEGNPLLKFLSSGKNLKTSRCGEFHRAIKLLKENINVAASMEKYIITHEFEANKLPEAFKTARDSSSIKVIIRHG